MASPGPDSRGLRLLSLDGGGIRGLSELFILREIMRNIQAQENLESMPLPSEYFDMIGGTSTGGLIALMFGRLRMSVDDVIKDYSRLAEEVFSSSKWHGEGKFKASKLEKAIKQIVHDHTDNKDNDTRMKDPLPDGEVCKTFVCAMAAENMTASIPRLFRTYTVSQNQSVDCTIWEAARATSAAPTFFESIEIMDTGVKERFIDGGLGCNNPVLHVLQEAELSFPGRHVACVVSIGTGKARTIAVPKPGMFQGMFQRLIPLDVIMALKSIATDCEQTEEVAQRRFIEIPNFYFRFNVEQGMQDVSLAQWEKMSSVKTHTEQYLRTAGVRKRVADVVKAIQQRREVMAVEAHTV